MKIQFNPAVFQAVRVPQDNVTQQEHVIFIEFMNMLEMNGIENDVDPNYTVCDHEGMVCELLPGQVLVKVENSVVVLEAHEFLLLCVEVE